MHHVVAILGYGLLTLVFTYPTAFRLTSHIPGGEDAPWFLWQLWWFKRAIVDLRQTPLITDRIFFPLTDVVANWQSPYNELFAIPLQAAFGTVVAYNLLILSTFVLSGYGMYLLTWRMVRRRDLAFLGGLIFAFCAYRGTRGLHHLSLATTQWLPLALLMLINLWHRPSLRRGAAAGVGAGLVALSSPYYLAYFLVPVAVTGAIYALIWERPRLRRSQLWMAVAVAGVVAGLMTAPFYVNYLQAPADLRVAAQEAGASIAVYTADILSWLLPPAGNPLWGTLLAGIYDRFTSGYLVETSLFFGLLSLVLGFATLLLRRLRRPPVTFWQILAIVTLLLSFGPVLRFWREPLLAWMPYRLAMLLPGSYAFRVPARIGITTILATTVLAMLLLRHMLHTRPTWRWPVLLTGWSALLLVNMSVGFPYPSASVVIPPLYAEIAAAPGDTAVLELPAGEMFLDQMSWAMYYQTAHGKPLVSGYLGRRPERLREFQRSAPYVKRFFSQDWTSFFAAEGNRLVDRPPDTAVASGQWPADVRNAAALLRDQGIGHVVLHRDPERPGYFEAAGLLLNQGLGPPTQSEEDILLFTVAPPPVEGQGNTAALDQAALAFDSAFTQPFLAMGSQARAVEAGEAAMTATLPLSGTWSIRGAVTGESAAGLTFRVNGHDLEPELVPLFDGVYAFRLRYDFPAGSHTLTLQSPARRSNQAPDCADLCVIDLAISLDLPDRPLATPLARFADEQGAQLELLEARILPPTGDESVRRLLTTWRPGPGQDSAALRANPPTLFVHLTGPENAIIDQADHTLGENSLWLSDTGAEQVFYDLVPLPTTTNSQLEVEVGLWYPERQAYFWLTEPPAEDAVRFSLGRVADLVTD